MPHLRDPDGRQSAEIVKIADFKDKSVLEIGCGDGSLTWSYAPLASRVTAIDPSEEDILSAKISIPPELAVKVEFFAANIIDFSPAKGRSPYDISLFSWSL